MRRTKGYQSRATSWDPIKRGIGTGPSMDMNAEGSLLVTTALVAVERDQQAVRIRDPRVWIYLRN